MTILATSLHPKIYIFATKNLRSGTSGDKISKYTLWGQNKRFIVKPFYDDDHYIYQYSYNYIDLNIVVVKVAFYIQRYSIEIPRCPFSVPLTSKTEQYSLSLMWCHLLEWSTSLRTVGTLLLSQNDYSNVKHYALWPRVVLMLGMTSKEHTSRKAIETGVTSIQLIDQWPSCWYFYFPWPFS